MMTMTILVIIRLVQVGLVTYSYQIIKTVDDLKLIKPYLIDRINEIKTVLPSVELNDYPYNSADTCKQVFKRALDDAISEKIALDWFLRFLRRIYIVSGLAQSDTDYGKDIKELHDMAMYIKINEE